MYCVQKFWVIFLLLKIRSCVSKICNFLVLQLFQPTSPHDIVGIVVIIR